MSLRLGTNEENESLFEKIREKFGNVAHSRRLISTPGGNFFADIYWLENPGIWANLAPRQTGDTLYCQFGTSLPDNESEPITMDVQINLPIRNNHRAGSAVIDEEDNTKIYLGHRGYLGGGRNTVKLEEFRKNIVGFSTQKIAPSNKDYFLIGPVNDNEFLIQLWKYVRECRRIRRAAMGFLPEAISPIEMAVSPGTADEREEPKSEIDALERRNASIKCRRGQKAFRDNLIQIYQGKCAISGCDILDVLEAAHLKPYAGSATNTPSNGLLLRADLHTLLDCGLLAVDPITYKVKLSTKIMSSDTYKHFNGKEIKIPNKKNQRPGKENLKYVYDSLLK